MKARFLLKKNPDPKKESKIMLAVTIDTKKVRIATPFYCLASKWVQGRPHKNQTLLIEQLNQFEAGVNGFLTPQTTELQLKNFVHTMINGVDEDRDKVSTVLKKYLKEKKELVIESTYEKVKFDLDEFDNFKKQKVIVDINKQLLKDFVAKIRKMDKEVSTLNNYIKNLKAFLKWLYDNDYTLTNNAKYLTKIPAQDKDIIAISDAELLAIELYEAPSEKLERIRDLFLFGCYSGLRFGDLQRVEKNMIQDSSHVSADGEVIATKTLHIRQQKTKNPVNIPLIPEALHILEKYDYVLPQISAQKGNDYIKLIFKELKIHRMVKITVHKAKSIVDLYKPLSEIVSFHVARKSFITIALSKGIHAKVVQMISGHKKDATFNKYIAFSSDTLQTEITKISRSSRVMKVVPKDAV